LGAGPQAGLRAAPHRGDTPGDAWRTNAWPLAHAGPSHVRPAPSPRKDEETDGTGRRVVSSGPSRSSPARFRGARAGSAERVLQDVDVFDAAVGVVAPDVPHFG
jgi:hypothetical protein